MHDDQLLAWRITGATVRGASHRRSDLPNQDALAWRSPTASGAPAVLAIADGHGSPLYIRSDRGARIAVHTAIALLADFAAAHATTPALSAVKRVAAERLPRDLVLTWNQGVAADLAAEPISEREIAAAKIRAPRAALDRLADDPRLAYGATLLAAVLTQRYLLAVQLGDGDILTVNDDGTAAHWPLAPDPLLIANETTSLCSPDAWRHVRTYLQPVHAAAPQLVLLATDGYANSFVDQGGLLQAGGDMLTAIRDEGLAAVSRQLPAWLRATSAAGSGDDITVALAVRAGDPQPSAQP